MLKSKATKPKFGNKFYLRNKKKTGYLLAKKSETVLNKMHRVSHQTKFVTKPFFNLCHKKF